MLLKLLSKGLFWSLYHTPDQLTIPLNKLAQPVGNYYANEINAMQCNVLASISFASYTARMQMVLHQSKQTFVCCIAPTLTCSILFLHEMRVPKKMYVSALRRFISSDHMYCKIYFERQTTWQVNTPADWFPTEGFPPKTLFQNYYTFLNTLKYASKYVI